MISEQTKRRWESIIWNQFQKLGLIERYQIGGHCGCCGAWVSDKITMKAWGWTLCKKCAENVD